MTEFDPLRKFGSEFSMTGIVKVFGCRPSSTLAGAPGQGRRSKTSKEGNRESEGRRRRRDLWGFERRRRRLASGRNDDQSRFRRIERSEGAFSVGNGIIFFAAATCERRPEDVWASAVGAVERPAAKESRVAASRVMRSRS